MFRIIKQFVRIRWRNVAIVLLLILFVMGTAMPALAEVVRVQPVPGLDNLSDVDAGTPSDDDVLSWDTGSSKWINRAIIEGLWEIDGTETQLITADELDMRSLKIINVADPTLDQDAATKKYVDDNIVTDHGSLGGLADDDHTQYLLVDGTRALTGDLDFAKYKAIALVCDSGATIPASPTAGQWFLHTPTGRTILYQYDGSTWGSIISVGSLTVYVDSTDGTDDLDHGTAVDADAFATIQYAIDCIPGAVGGNVIVSINDETYTEDIVIGGKVPTGDYTITLQGATPTVLDSGLLVGSAVRASIITTSVHVWGSVTRASGTWTIDQRKDKWLRFTSGTCDGEYFLIDSNTTTVATIIGRFYYAGTPAVNDTFNIEEPATQIDSFQLKPLQVGVRFNDIDFVDIPLTSGYTPFAANSESQLHRCRLAPASGTTSIWAVVGAYVEFDTCLSDNIRYLLRNASLIGFVACKVYVGVANRGIQLDSACMIQLGSTLIDGEGIVGSKGIYTFGLGFAVANIKALRTNVSLTANIIRDCTEGIRAELNAVGLTFIPADDRYCKWIGCTDDVVILTGGQVG